MVTIITLFANGAGGVVPSLSPLPHPKSKKSEDEKISILFFMNIKILAWYYALRTKELKQSSMEVHRRIIDAFFEWTKN